jgi:ferredoxin-type protein NapG
MGEGKEAKPDSHVTRRAFVGLAAKAAAVVAIGGAIRYTQPQQRIRRPPGALPEDEFLSVCIRCDVCYWTCPYAYITPVLITESIIAAGTPRLKAQWCPNCRRCIPACPVGALVSRRS